MRFRLTPRSVTLDDLENKFEFTENCRGGPVPDRLSAALISRKFAVARACVRGPSRQADVSAAG